MAVLPVVHLLPRRTVLKAAGVVPAAAGLARGRTCTALAAPDGTYWVNVQDPDCGSAPKTCSHGYTLGGRGRGGRYACVALATNMRWANPSAVSRAHECRRSTLKKIGVTKAEYERMFGKCRNRRSGFNWRGV